MSTFIIFENVQTEKFAKYDLQGKMAAIKDDSYLLKLILD